MSNIDKQALREAATEATQGGWYVDYDFDVCHESGAFLAETHGDNLVQNAKFIAAANPATVLALLDELEAKDKLNAELMEKQRLIDICQGQGLEHRIAAEKRAEAAESRIAELSASHGKLRDTMAAIHNTIRKDGSYTPLAAILNAAKCAHEESAIAAGIGKGGVRCP